MHTTTTRRAARSPHPSSPSPFAAALAACGDDDDRSDTNDTSTPTSAAIADPAATIPDTPVGEQLRWALDHLATGGQTPTLDEINEHISAEFLRDVMPAETVIGIFGQTVADAAGSTS